MTIVIPQECTVKNAVSLTHFVTESSEGGEETDAEWAR
jgi:hypothetical protein